MSKTYDFIKECGSFFVLTNNDDFPAGRPFGAIMEYEDALYITTADTKAVYKQLKANNNIQLLALKPGTREWIRVTGIAEECADLAIKARMLKECPNLRKYHTAADEEHFNVFKVIILNTEFK